MFMMEKFHYGLRNDVKDLRCDNRLFERRSERKFQMSRTRLEFNYGSIVAKSFPRESYNASPVNTLTPMEIDTTRHHGPLLTSNVP